MEKERKERSQDRFLRTSELLVSQFLVYFLEQKQIFEVLANFQAEKKRFGQGFFKRFYTLQISLILRITTKDSRKTPEGF